MQRGDRESVVYLPCPAQTEEGWRYCQGDKTANRPPELLTRDHVARCIVREVKEGRGIFGLYPPSAETKAEYEAWKSKNK